MRNSALADRKAESQTNCDLWPDEWESKAVEAQIESFENGRFAEIKERPTSARVELFRRKESLLPARGRVLSDFETAQNSRHRDMLKAALADLEAKLAESA